MDHMTLLPSPEGKCTDGLGTGSLAASGVRSLDFFKDPTGMIPFRSSLSCTFVSGYPLCGRIGTGVPHVLEEPAIRRKSSDLLGR